MGGWKLEVFRMAMYVSFPVGIFYLFNQPKLFAHLVLEKRQKCFPPEDPESIKFFNDLKRELNERRDRMLTEKMES